MRFAAMGLGLALAAMPAAAQEATEVLARDGLSAAEAALLASGADNDADRFLLGGVRFLRAIEVGFQQRWAMNLNELGPLPVLRIDLPPNPAPEPFDPAFAETTFADLVDGMAAAREPLDAIEGDFAVELDLATLWFDVNANGARDPGEGLFDLAAGTLGLGGGPTEPAEPLLVRFDRADAEWLAAYTHVLAGIAEIVLAFHPTPVVERIVAANAELAALRGPDFGSGIVDPEVGRFVSLAAMYLMSLEQRPDAAHAAAAHGHFLEMVARNRAFWTLAAAETDDMLEWIPNDTQTQALGLEFPQGLGPAWLGVLDDAEKVLNGELLVPYVWVGPDAGLNLKRLFDDPPEINLIGWIHGADALPYLERGPVMTSASWNRFEAMLLGQGAFFAILLN